MFEIDWYSFGLGVIVAMFGGVAVLVVFWTLEWIYNVGEAIRKRK